MNSVDDYYELVDDIYEKKDFLGEIEERYDENDGLFKKSTIAHMIAVEQGRDKKSIAKIGEIKPGEEATLVGKIVDLGTLKTFKSKGKDGKVRNVRIDDGHGSIKLVLWNEQTDMVKEMKKGQRIRVINGYVQDRGYGLQISTGKWGEVIMEDESKD